MFCSIHICHDFYPSDLEAGGAALDGLAPINAFDSATDAAAAVLPPLLSPVRVPSISAPSKLAEFAPKRTPAVPPKGLAGSFPLFSYREPDTPIAAAPRLADYRERGWITTGPIDAPSFAQIPILAMDERADEEDVEAVFHPEAMMVRARRVVSDDARKLRAGGLQGASVCALLVQRCVRCALEFSAVSVSIAYVCMCLHVVNSIFVFVQPNLHKLKWKLRNDRSFANRQSATPGACSCFLVSHAHACTEAVL